MNPSSSVFSGSYRGGSRLQTPSGTTITIDSPLEPFFQPNGEFYTSRIAADLRNFGYTYEGLEYWTKSQAQMRADATRLVNRLYSPADAASGVAGGPAMFAAKKPSTRYFIQLELDMAQVPRPCQVQAWIGGKFAGSMVVMQQPGHGIMRGGFPIDNAVREAGLEKLAKDKAVAKIKESLKVNIVKVRLSPISGSLPLSFPSSPAATEAPQRTDAWASGQRRRSPHQVRVQLQVAARGHHLHPGQGRREPPQVLQPQHARPPDRLIMMNPPASRGLLSTAPFSKSNISSGYAE